ncbi:MAG: hypothetical protein QY304_00525 [Candidatus Paceibacterota bacterium]|nr:MAG: hypothetical protein QY304_00525 [Candidatus Paceibacterota bacterium]
MSWSSKRIQEYKEGGEASWLEKRALEHAEPIHLILIILSLPLLVYGLWEHSWFFIGIGIALNFVGHINTWIRK